MMFCRYLACVVTLEILASINLFSAAHIKTTYYSWHIYEALIATMF